MAVLAAWWSDWFFEPVFLGNEVWRWLALLGALLAAFVVGKVVSFMLARQGARMQKPGEPSALGQVLDSLSRPSVMVALAGGLYIAGTFMNLSYMTGTGPRSLQAFWHNVCRTIAVLAVAWTMFRLVTVLEIYLIRWTSKTRTQLDDQLVPLLRKTLRVFVVIIAALFIAQNIFRWDIGALIAGLGIGGLAFALAAKDMLSNFFGSVTIFADRPFQMGDRIIVQGYDGFVEEVGFRSTRIRTFFGHLVTVPNAVIASTPVENAGVRPYIRRNFEITVTYDTPPEKVQQAMDILRDMLTARKNKFPADLPGWVHFMNYNAASLGLAVTYWFGSTDWKEYLDFTSDFNLELLRRYNEAGIEFAFPTQTVYVRKDGGDAGGG